MDKQERRPEGPLKDNEYLCTFKFYDSKGRRLTICARQDGVTLKVVVLTLSHTPDPETNILDTFSRKKGREIYDENCKGKEGDEMCKGLRFDVPVSEDKPRFSFFSWCNEHYYKMKKEVVKVPQERVYLVKRNGKQCLFSHRILKKEKEKSESESKEVA